MAAELIGGRVDLSNVSLRVGDAQGGFLAVRDVTLTIRAGQFVTLLGPSGCGKTTLLHAIAGLNEPTAGQISVDGEAVRGAARDRGVVFQQQSLLPWRSVLDNVAFGLKMQGVARKERHAAAREIIELVGLSGFEQHYPAQLSGGMQQRVEIARVLINRPRVMLMDEPFGALDAQTRLMMQELLLSVWTRFRTTIIFVTHDIDEAVLLSDRICVMGTRPGRIREQSDVPAGRPRRPEDLAHPEMIAIRHHCLQLIRQESMKSLRASTPEAGLAAREGA
jgi:NitT/TauT family transport system ATP-binding protein